ncbi:hypothetical protein BC332_03012 [Capsicum chinense]|nr:hypothetical protein BC332_03012 [Capsicum chinense]
MCRSGGLWLVRSSRCNDKTGDLQVVPCVEGLPGEWWSGDMSRWVNDGTKYLADHDERRTENWQIHDPDESIVCLESHLKSIRLIDFEGGENEIELLRFFLKNAQILEKLTIFWGKYAFWDMHPDKAKETSEKVLKLPRTSSQVILTFLDAKPESSSCNWTLKSYLLHPNIKGVYWFGSLLISSTTILRLIHATRRDVQELVLSFFRREPFEVPYCLVTCESLQVLKLYLSGNLLILPNHLGFRKLKLHHLEQVI